MKTIIHVNMHVIKKNHKTGARDPVLTVKTYKENKYAHEVEIRGPSRVVYNSDKPLPCGARCWIETEAEVICHPAEGCSPPATSSVGCSGPQSESGEANQS